jgi:isoleucyl-tRNA synthetase
VTRERVWGTPLPIWVCEECWEKTAAFSRKEIVRLAAELPDGPGFELHRPWTDRVVLRCQKCGGRAIREPFVLDAWHNSGAAPFASFTDKEFGELVPVEFLTEAIDQTRAWAYTLLLLGVIRSGKPKAPYRAFLFQGHVLSATGGKMSKSEGNAVWALDFLRSNSADLARFWVLSKSPPDSSMNFDTKEMAGRPYQVLNTLYHLHLYLQQNGEVDGYNTVRHTLAWASERKLLTMVDKWVLRRLEAAEENSRAAFRSGRYNEAAKALEDMIIMQLSQTYVRLVRNELWEDDPKKKGRRLAIYAVLGSALRKVDELLHPVSPFVTEYLHQEVFAKKKWDEPLLAAGRVKLEGPGSKGAEETVDFALKVEEACNSAREKARLKRRWPLREAVVLVRPASKGVALRARGTVSLLCNVKGVSVETRANGFPATFTLKPNMSRVGALFKERTRAVLASLRPLEGPAALRAYLSGRPVRSGDFEVPLSVFELVTVPRQGFEVVERGGVFVALPRERDQKLVAEGLVRDLARRLQALRKEKGFVPTAMLRSASVAGLEEEDLGLVRPLGKQLAYLVRVRSVRLESKKQGERGWSEVELDGRPLYLKVG